MSLTPQILALLPTRLRRAAAGISERDGRIATWLKARAAAGVPVPDPVWDTSGAAVRLLIAPFNYSGQAWEWARAVRESDAGRSGAVSALNLAVRAPGDRGFTTDAAVPTTVFLGSAEWKARQGAELAGFTHMLIESFTSPLGNGRGDAFRRELAAWRDGGQQVAFLCHGSDIRSPRAHRERNRFSPFAEFDGDARRLQQRVDAAHRMIERTGLPVFVSTPDLLHDVPHATWLPLVIEEERWSVAGRSRELLTGTPVVVHAPTSPQLKGSAHVERAASRLGGVIDYRPLSGVPAAHMPDAVASADIVVDQLLIGSYGVAACEAMAAGRAVVGNVDAEIRARVEEAAGVALPIVQADPETLESVLAELAADPELLRSHAAAGPAFVRAVHSGNRTVPALSEFLSLG